MKILITATATVSREIEVDLPGTATSEERYRAAASALNGPDNDGSGEDLENRLGDWTIIKVDPDSIVVDASGAPRMTVDGPPPSDDDLEAIKNRMVPHG